MRYGFDIDVQIMAANQPEIQRWMRMERGVGEHIAERATSNGGG
jgi:hypothetical protein